MNTVTVDLGARSYPIHIKPGILNQIAPIIQGFSDSREVALITDETVSKLYGQSVLDHLSAAGYTTFLFTVPAGEDSKSYQYLEKLHTKMLKAGLKRDSLVIALGGGVVGDLAGFVAATYLRGIGFIQIPTTLLAQVDSSVGGKTGINHILGKNLIGAFHQPLGVLIDPDALKTLSVRDMWGGLGEVLKYGLIRDVEFFETIEQNLESLFSLSDMDQVSSMLAMCCQIKADVVSADEKEGGLRRILNFGHTLCHALEAVTGYDYFRHGEAVVYGLDWAAWVSMRFDLLDSNQYERIHKLIGRFELPPLPENLEADQLQAKMALDKKQTAAGLNLVLLDAIGSTVIQTVQDATDEIKGWLNELRK
ncbi:3-dehydroquinate synthase [candidate division KSB1 bacterium]|nr:3-dehydroquinate synthase [candidate division KSB1 bacterium]